MEGGRKEEPQPNGISWMNTPGNIQREGKRNSLYFPQFIWLGPSKGRDARIDALKRCAIAWTLSPSETNPEVVEGILREVYNSEYPWKAVLIGPRMYLIEFPSTSLLEKAAISQVLFGSKDALAVRRWQENIGSCGTLQKFWVRIKGLPRECWCWDDVKGILDYFCGLEKIEYFNATQDSRDYVRALVVAAGPEYFPIFVRVCINSKLHNVYIHAETGQSVNRSDLGETDVSPELTPGLGVPPENKRREVSVKRGYIVSAESRDSGRAFEPISCTGPYVPYNIESYSKKIGPLCLSREACSKDEMRSTGGITTGVVRKRSDEVNKGFEEDVHGKTMGASKRRPLELFPDDFWISINLEESGNKESNMKSIGLAKDSTNKKDDKGNSGHGEASARKNGNSLDLLKENDINKGLDASES